MMKYEKTYEPIGKLDVGKITPEKLEEFRREWIRAISSVNKPMN